MARCAGWIGHGHQRFKGYQQLKPVIGVDSTVVAGILRNAWGTELLLDATGELADDEIIALANNWAVVQAYYAAYHAAQALTVSGGQPRPQSHPLTQTLFSSFWVVRNAQLSPWSLGFKEGNCINTPAQISIQTIKPWITCDDDTCWSLAALALRTTRNDALAKRIRDERIRHQSDARRAWKAVERDRQAEKKKPRIEPSFPLPHLKPSEKAGIDQKFRPTTILDYLFRLRMRSNYEDAAMFTDGPEIPIESRMVHQSLCHIVSATLLVHELMIGRMIGAKSLEKTLNDWMKSAGTLVTKLGVHARAHLIV